MTVWKQSSLCKRWGSTLCPSWHTRTRNDLMHCCRTCFLELSSEILNTRCWEIHWKKSVPSLIWESLIVRFGIRLSLSIQCIVCICSTQLPLWICDALRFLFIITNGFSGYNIVLQFVLMMYCLQIRKTLEFYEQLRQRMGVVIVGPSGSGKTTLWKNLKNALAKSGQVVKTYVMNPKAMPRTQVSTKWIFIHCVPEKMKSVPSLIWESLIVRFGIRLSSSIQCFFKLSYFVYFCV